MFGFCLTRVVLLCIFFFALETIERARSQSTREFCRGEVTTCEHDTVKISCESGTRIAIVDAMYGRLVNDTETCTSTYPLHQLLADWCAKTSESEKATRIITTMCNGKSFCQIYASNGVFGDPCAGTYKYLKLCYVCLSEGTLTTENYLTTPITVNDKTINPNTIVPTSNAVTDSLTTITTLTSWIIPVGIAIVAIILVIIIIVVVIWQRKKRKPEANSKIEKPNHCDPTINNLYIGDIQRVKESGKPATGTVLEDKNKFYQSLNYLRNDEYENDYMKLHM